jgi:hypothetical protein
MDVNQTAVDAAVGNMEKAVQSFQADITAAFNQMFQHVENMAAHIIALEGIVRVLCANSKIDSAEVEKWINGRIVSGNQGKSTAVTTTAIALDLLGVAPADAESGAR